MWIRKSDYLTSQRRISELETLLRTLQSQYEGLHTLSRQADTAYRDAVGTMQLEIRKLYERLITAEAEGRKGTALIALWTIRVNQLTLERDQLLVRALPGLDVQTPHINLGSVTEPAINFEDDPMLAPPGPDGLTRMPDESDLGGASGQAYNGPPTEY